MKFISELISKVNKISRIKATSFYFILVSRWLILSVSFIFLLINRDSIRAINILYSGIIEGFCTLDKRFG